MDKATRQSTKPVEGVTVQHTSVPAVLPDADETAWLIERYIQSTLHYWTGRPDKHIGVWTPQHAAALRFARRSDAECMLTWHCGGDGRVVEHRWILSASGRQTPQDPQGHIEQLKALYTPPVALPAVNGEDRKAEARAVADRLTRLRLSSDEDVSTAVQDAAELLYDWPEVNAELLEALKGLLDVIAADDLVPESVSYMKQARKAVRDAEVSR